MEESKGDIDVLQIANQENSQELLRRILYEYDRSICKLTNGDIHVIFSTGSGTKEFLKKHCYTVMTDLYEILKLGECIFFHTENNVYVTIAKSEETKFLFDLIDNINFRSKESGRWARIRWTDAKDTSEEQLTVYRINNINNYDDDTNIDTCFPSTSSIGSDLLADRQSNARINRDINLKRIVRLTQRCDSGTYYYTNARHQEFVERAQRKCSFSRWMYEKVQDPERLVDAGFFYTGEKDLVRCFQCDIGFKDFSETDDPLHEHVRYSGQCEFLLNFLGLQKLEQLKAHLRNSDPLYSSQQQWLKINNRQKHPIHQTSHHQYRHPVLRELNSRLRTYDKWPNAIYLTPTQLAKAGFFYTGTADTVRCWACDGGLQEWDPLDDPWIEHCRWFPFCPFAAEIKGEEFIHAVQRAAETGDDSLLLKLHLNDKQQEEAKDSTRQVAAQLKEMGYKKDVINAAMKALDLKGNCNPGLTASIDEIEKERYKGSVKKKRSTASSRRENERLTCTKCRSGNRECLFLHCKHLRMCMTCSENLHRCPDCNATIRHKIKVFMA